MNYFDSHTHVNFAAFEDDYREVLERAREAGVLLVNVGTQQDTSQRAVELAQEFDHVYATVGLHPVHTAKSYHDSDELGGDKGFTSRGEEFDYDVYKRLAEDERVVAIGECGLDYYRIDEGGEEVKELQRDAFLQHMKLAHEAGKPLMIHCRDALKSNPVAFGRAYDDLIEILKDNEDLLVQPVPGIMHFFAGSKKHAQEFLDLGFSFTFGGVVTFARDYDEVVRMIPDDRILSETDAPYVTPTPHRGKRNEPVFVIDIVKKLAEIRGVSENTMAEMTYGNACRVFGIHFNTKE